MSEAMTVAQQHGLMQTLAAGERGARLGRAGLLALALQLRPAWVLLGAWVLWGGAGSPSWLPRLRFLPAHPDWYVPTLVQSCVTALTLVGLARRFRLGWALLTAVVAGGVAWAVSFAFMPSGLDGFSLMLRPPQEMLSMGMILACLALTWNRPGPWGAVPIVALVGGAGAGSIPFLFSNTIFGSPWPEGWPRDLAREACGVALVAIALALLRRSKPRFLGLDGTGVRWLGCLVGVWGLLLLALLHLAAGSRFSGWSVDDSRRLLGASALLAGVVSAGVVAGAWRRRRLRYPGGP